MRHARDGVESEFSTNARSKRIPRCARRSMLGVGASFDSALPYALMHWNAWSSHIIYTMLGRCAPAFCCACTAAAMHDSAASERHDLDDCSMMKCWFSVIADISAGGKVTKNYLMCKQKAACLAMKTAETDCFFCSECCLLGALHEVSDKLFAFASEHINNRNLHHGVASWLLAH